MIAVADASPLCYLVLIGEIDLLPKLFRSSGGAAGRDRGTAARRCSRGGSKLGVKPASVDLHRQDRRRCLRRPGKASGRRARSDHLAESIKADLILLDEKAARRVAAERGLRVTGILGVLGEAATRGFVDLASAIDRLRKTSFRCSPALLKATLDRFGNP